MACVFEFQGSSKGRFLQTMQRNATQKLQHGSNYCVALRICGIVETALISDDISVHFSFQ